MSKTGFLNNRRLFLTVPEAGKSKIEVPSDSVSGESSLPGLQTAIFSLCPHVVERKREAEKEAGREGAGMHSGVCSYEDTNPIGSVPHPYDFI